MRTPLIILGAGGFAREVLNWIDFGKNKLVGMFTEYEDPGLTVFGVPIVSDLMLYRQAKFVIGVGDPKLKEKLVSLALGAGLSPARAVIHPSAVIGSKCDIGEGSVICPFACITTNVTVGQYAIVNLSATIGHDSTIDQFVTISPGANISGRCSIGMRSYIGTNSAIREGIVVGMDSIVGMGAVVTKNISAETTVAGNPARPLLK